MRPFFSGRPPEIVCPLFLTYALFHMVLLALGPFSLASSVNAIRSVSENRPLHYAKVIFDLTGFLAGQGHSHKFRAALVLEVIFTMPLALVRFKDGGRNERILAAKQSPSRDLVLDIIAKTAPNLGPQSAARTGGYFGFRTQSIPGCFGCPPPRFVKDQASPAPMQSEDEKALPNRLFHRLTKKPENALQVSVRHRPFFSRSLSPPKRYNRGGAGVIGVITCRCPDS